MHYLVFTIIALLGATISVLAKKDKKTNSVLRTFLLWIIAINVGVAGLIGFTAHTFMAESVSMFIGWMPGSPFQFEVAIANLMLGILGFMCLWFTDDVWFVTVISTTIFGWGAAYGHIKDMMLNQNYAPGNAGTPLYVDVIAPVVLIALFIAYKSTKGKSKAAKAVKAPKKTKVTKAKKTKKK